MGEVGTVARKGSRRISIQNPSGLTAPAESIAVTYASGALPVTRRGSAGSTTGMGSPPSRWWRTAVCTTVKRYPRPPLATAARRSAPAALSTSAAGGPPAATGAWRGSGPRIGATTSASPPTRANPRAPTMRCTGAAPGARSRARTRPRTRIMAAGTPSICASLCHRTAGRAVRLPADRPAPTHSRRRLPGEIAGRTLIRHEGNPGLAFARKRVPRAATRRAADQPRGRGRPVTGATRASTRVRREPRAPRERRHRSRRTAGSGIPPPSSGRARARLRSRRSSDPRPGPG